MTGREKEAKRKAYEFTRENVPWWDLDGVTEQDFMRLDAEELAEGLAGYFGDDAPRDIIDELKAAKRHSETF